MTPSDCYLLRYRSLHEESRSLAFPCDAKGVIAFDVLSERARNNYLFARAFVGRQFAAPVVETVH